METLNIYLNVPKTHIMRGQALTKQDNLDSYCEKLYLSYPTLVRRSGAPDGGNCLHILAIKPGQSGGDLGL